MSLTLHVPDTHDLKPRLTVFGIGGAGGNAVNNMIARSLEGVEFVVANTDAQALSISDAKDKIQLGEELTEGLGAGAKPEIGARAAEESIEKITDFLMGSHMLFITAGMGGGTGTGAAPVIAQAARQMGILTVGVVTKPFHFEGARRMTQADAGIVELQKYVDTLIVIPNQNLFRIASEKTTFAEAFGLADDVLYQGVKGVTDLMVRPGMVNLDFADIRSVMDEMGKAMMGTGEAEGEDRALLAAENAIANPLLDEISLKGAKGVLINITGGDDLTLHEVDEASNKIRSEVDPDANIIFGTAYDPELSGRIRVSVVATGIDSEEFERVNSRPTKRQSSDHSTSVHSAPAADEVSREDDLFSARNVETIAHNSTETFASREPSMMDDEDEIAYPAKVESVSTETELAEQEFEAFEEDEPAEIVHRASELRSEAPQGDMFEDEPVQETNFEHDLARQRLEQAARATPVSAPKLQTEVAPPARNRFGIDSMIRKMSGQDENEMSPPAAVHAQPAARQESHSHLPPRRAEPQSRMDEGDRQRVDIPAFLRRKAN